MKWKMKKDTDWNRWFAWTPATVEGHQVWLETVERRWVEMDVTDPSSHGYWEYRLPKQVLDYSGGGKVSVPVKDIVSSEKVQQHVKEVRRIFGSKETAAERMERILWAIAQWDMLNPVKIDDLADLRWLKTQVDIGLGIIPDPSFSTTDELVLTGNGEPVRMKDSIVWGNGGQYGGPTGLEEYQTDCYRNGTIPLEVESLTNTPWRKVDYSEVQEAWEKAYDNHLKFVAMAVADTNDKFRRDEIRRFHDMFDGDFS